MHLTQRELHEIAEKAMSLWERVDNDLVSSPLEGLSRGQHIDDRLYEWRKVVADGDRELFEKRLEYDGLTSDMVRAYLGNAHITTSVDLPSWAMLLNTILDAVSLFTEDRLDDGLWSAYGFLEKDSPFPFEDIFIPFVLYARETLKTTTGDLYNFVSDNGHSAMERFLLYQLTERSSRVLEVEFNSFLACLQLQSLSYLEIRKDKSSRKYYVDFINYLYDGKLIDIFKEYCVLARLLTIRIDQWTHLYAEFLERLQTDLHEIQDTFSQGELGDVVDLHPGLSDPHCNGRTVITIIFESGTKIIYKPKAMGLEAEYFNFVEWLNGQEIKIDFKAPRVINKGSYGWVEFVEHSPMQNDDQAKRYFTRAGMLLCLVYVFDGIDFHQENVIACGEYPVPIDLETFFHHRVSIPDDVLELISAASKLINDSVLRTHFLPQLYKIKDKFLDITGMGSIPGQDVSIETLRWTGINSDAMEYSLELLTPPTSKNVATIDKCPLAPEDYKEEVIEGFREMYQHLMNLGKNLFRHNELMLNLFQNTCRFVFRSTAFYASILRKTTHPDYQRDGVDFSIQLDILSRPFASLDEKSIFWDLVREEEKSLWRMDIPKFTPAGDCDSLYLEHGDKVQGCFLKSPLEYVQEKIHRLCDDDLNWQLRLIRGTLDAREFRKPITSSGSEQIDPNEDCVLPINKKQLIDYALNLAGEIRKQAIFSKNDEPSWIIMKGLPTSKKSMLQATPSCLYDGSGGIALFFAMLENIRPGSGYESMVYSTLAMYRRWLKKSSSSIVSQPEIGGYAGIGSMVYSLLKIGKLLDDNSLIEDAQQTAALIRKEHIDKDNNLDITRGSGGLILSLLALHRVIHDKESLQKAAYCGEHLLQHRTKSSNGFNVWKTMAGSPHLTGFSHGAAGIAYSLLKLYQITGKTEFFDAAMDGILFEDAEFDSQENNWPDHRIFEDDEAEKGESRFMCAWCHGAPGIALSRVGTLDILDSVEIRNDIQKGLQTTCDSPIHPIDHLCCGNTGRAEVLLTAGIKLSEPKWIQEAHSITSRFINRADKDGFLRPNFVFDFFNPTLFQGSAGLGFHLLRLAEPKQFPSILLFE